MLSDGVYAREKKIAYLAHDRGELCFCLLLQTLISVRLPVSSASLMNLIFRMTYSPSCVGRGTGDSDFILMFSALEPMRAVRAKRLQCPVHLLATRVDGLLPAAHQGAVSKPVHLETWDYVISKRRPGAEIFSLLSSRKFLMSPSFTFAT